MPPPTVRVRPVCGYVARNPADPIIGGHGTARKDALEMACAATANLLPCRDRNPPAAERLCIASFRIKPSPILAETIPRLAIQDSDGCGTKHHEWTTVALCTGCS